MLSAVETKLFVHLVGYHVQIVPQDKVRNDLRLFLA